MKARPEETMEEFPDTPPWTMFFDGPLYQKYDEFMRTKDFSKILLNTKLRLANSPEPEVVSSTHSIEDDHWDKEQDADPTGNTYPYVSEDFYRRSKEEKKRRTRKTRAFILLGLVIMAALAFGTALVIHYFFIPPLEERNPNNFVNVSFATNTTSSNTSEIDQTTTGDFGDDISSLLDAMSKDPHHHDHGHDHILNPDGKIFDDHFVTTTGTPPKSSTDYKSPRATTTKAKPTKTAVYVLHLNPKESGNDTGKVTRPPPDDKPKQYTSTVDLNHMDFFGMDDLDTTTYSLSSTETSNDFFAMDDEITTTITKKQSTTQADVLPELKKSQMATRKSIYVGTTTVQSTASQTSRVTLGTSTAKVKESSTQNEYNTTSTIKPPPATTAAMKETTPNILPSTTTVENVTKPTDSSNTTTVGTESANANYEWVTSILYQTTTIEAVPATSDVLPGNNNTNSSENTVRMRDVTSYTFENANIQCIVKHAIRWQSLSVKINQTWRPLEVTLYPSGDIKWSRSKTKRHDVSYDITNSTDGTGSNMTLGLIINDVQCRDANTYICTLRSEIVDRVAAGKLIVVGKPSQKITLTFGPAIIEDRAFRITASWQGGYPVPWTNISWTAVDANNRSHNLAEYGEYRDYELHEDHQFCQTTLEHSIVVFPKIHLNDTTVIVRPNLKSKRFFVDKSMEKYLEDVEPGIDKILVIPMDYCKNSKKEASLPHPYTPCSKFLRCLPGDMVVQLCPMGTCFFEKSQECA